LNTKTLPPLTPIFLYFYFFKKKKKKKKKPKTTTMLHNIEDNIDLACKVNTNLTSGR
jgi:preprotein translocase subunit YajC